MGLTVKWRLGQWLPGQQRWLWQWISGQQWRFGQWFSRWQWNPCQRRLLGSDLLALHCTGWLQGCWYRGG
jgi:hypothetical protein